MTKQPSITDAGTPGALAGASRPGGITLRERDGDLAALTRLLEATASGHGGATCVLGPPGIGKTVLLEAVQALAVGIGATCLTARGGEVEQDYSYGVVRQLFEAHLMGLPVRTRRAALTGAAAGAAAVVSGGEPMPADGDGSAFAVVHGLHWLCVNLARRQPLVLVVDDVHWADAASLAFLAYVQRRLVDVPVALVTASRPSTERPDGALVEHVTAAPDVRAILPEPLSAAAVGAVVADALGRHPSAELLAACVEATGGNPFLCSTLASTLADPERSDDAVAVAELTAQRAGRLILARLGHLPPAAAAVTHAVAILGTDVELRHAAALATLSIDEAAAAADALAGRRILRPGLPLDFAHPLVREAVRAGLPGATRARLHAAAARALARDGAPATRVAPHLLAAAPASLPWVVEALRAAASAAAGTGDASAAASYLRRALREPPDTTERALLLRELGTAELRAGEPESAAEHLEEARRLTPGPTDRARIARELAVALTTPGRYADAVEVLEDAIGRLDGVGDSLAARLEADLHQAAMMEPALYARAGERLVDRDRALAGGTPGERALLAAFATEDCFRGDDAATVRGCATRALTSGLLEDQGSHSSLWGNAAFPLICADGFVEAADAAARALADARRRGSPIGAARAYGVRALLAHRTGALPDAEADARASTELGLEAGFQVSLIPLGVLVETLAERGDLARARAALVAAGRTGPLAERFLECWVLQARGCLRLAAGEPAEAAADFAELERRGREGWRPWNPGMLPFRAGWVLALLQLGQREAALAVASDELERARRWGTRRGVGVALRSLGLARGGDDGIMLLRESVATLDGSGARLEHARSLVELGAAIRRSGQRSAAREPLHAGMDLAARCGAAPLAERARTELVATGARPRRQLRSGVDALSPSELRVARLAAEGMTNREIAQALFVTLRTVQVHLTNAYRKLGISSRAGLAEVLEPGAAP